MVSTMIFLVLLFVVAACSTPPKPGLQKITSEASTTKVGANQPSKAQGRLVVLFLSDTHQHLRQDMLNQSGGYARIKAYISNERSRLSSRDDLLVVFGGDAAGKGAWPCTKTQDRACFGLLKDLGIDLAVLGNWELRRPVRDLVPLLESSGLNWIGTNIDAPGLRTSRVVKDFTYTGPNSGQRIFVSGWTVPPTPGEIDLKKSGYQDIKRAATASDIDRLAKSSKGLPILLATHQEKEDDLNFLKMACDKKLNVIALLKAHNHVQEQGTTLDCNTPWWAAGAFGQAMVKLVFAAGPEGQSGVFESAETVLMKDFVGDPVIEEKIANLYKTVAPEADESLASSNRLLEKTDLAALAALAFRSVTRADIGVANMGAIKTALPAGVMTREALTAIYPYKDEVLGLDWSTKDLEKSLCKAATRERNDFEDNGSELVFAGLKLEGAGTPDCKVVLDKPRASVKVALSEFLVKRSPRWLGKDLKPAAFKFQIDTWAALELHLKRTGRQL
jgi:2',3'-cyclic-nucleotide 2'-phosphodiesterase (5'-nucleotidase family)